MSTYPSSVSLPHSARDSVVPKTLESLPDPLRNPFKLIAFDWDGTAVPDRTAEAREVTRVLQLLLERGMLIAVITGTHRGHVDRQFATLLSKQALKNLYILTNRGSEVFGYDADGNPVTLFSRKATEAEEHRLDEVAEAVVRRLQERTRGQLNFGIVYDRLNRRKVDLIPLPEWADPPKSQISELFKVTEKRLHDAGLAGGVAEAFQIAEDTARDHGMPDARITSDVKHLEIGLTDKGDSARWIMRELVDPRGISHESVAFGGDEFGYIGPEPQHGLEGSDYRMVLPEAKGEVFFSVGPEPNGLPPGIVHLGGGPRAFVAVLEYQLQRLSESGPEATQP